MPFKGQAACESEDSAYLNEEAARLGAPTGGTEDGMSEKYIIDLVRLSAEMEDRTRETQKLQKDIEQASRFALERMGPSFSNTDTPLDNFSAETLEGSKESDLSRLQLVSQPIKYDADVNKTRFLNFPGRDVLEHAIEEYSQQVSDLQKQLRETYELHDQQKSRFRQTIIELQTKLHENQIEKDALRLKECGRQSELLGRLQEAVVELRSLKQVEAEDQGKALSRRAEGAEQALQDVFTRLSEYERRSGKSGYGASVGPGQQQLGSAVEKALQDLENENRVLQERLQQVEGKMEDLLNDDQGRTESLLKEQKERIERLITTHDQEMAVLTKKLSSAQNNAASLQLQVQLLQEQIESQVSLHQTQMSDREAALDILRSDLLQEQHAHKVKVSELEEVLAQALSQAEQAQVERDLSLQQAEELDVQLGQLKTELRRTEEKLTLERLDRDAGQSVTLQSLRHKLEERHLAVQQLENLLRSLREESRRCENIQVSGDSELQEAQRELEQLRTKMAQLQQAKDEALQIQDRGEKEVARLRASLDERDRDVWLREEEARQGRAQLEEAQGRTQALHAQAELLRLKLEDAERSEELLRGPLEALQEERSDLTKRLEQLCQDNQQLKKALQEAEVRLKTVEGEKGQLQAALSDRTRRLHQLTMENRQVTAELDAQRVNLVKLKDKQEALKVQRSSDSEELRVHNLKLKAQLSGTRTDLERAQTSLRALQGADGHGLKVALGMQKWITAKREQIDFLQSRVQILEETTEKLTQEKHYQAMEGNRQTQELLFERESKRRLEAEMEVLHTSEKLLKSKTERLDAALHKMSDSFAECQEFIQKQEQEMVRLKLQHALELKELQGQTRRGPGNTHRPPITSPTLQPTSRTNSNRRMERPSSALELRSLVKELHSVIDEKQGPCTTHSAGRRCEMTKDTEEPRRKTRHSDSYIEQSPFPTTDLGNQDSSRAFSPNSEELDQRAARPCFTSSPRPATLGRRSPVHCLLTSDPPTDTQLPPRDIATVQMCELHEPPIASQQGDTTWQTCKKLQGKLDNLQHLVGDLQLKNQETSSMIKSQEWRIRKVKEQHQPRKREAFTPNKGFK